MARITIEDCTEKVPNRFQLVQMAAIRAKQLKNGAAALVKAEENKEVVVALREIAAGLVTSEKPFVAQEEVAAPEVETAPEAPIAAEPPAESPSEPTPES